MSRVRSTTVALVIVSTLLAGTASADGTRAPAPSSLRAGPIQDGTGLVVHVEADAPSSAASDLAWVCVSATRTEVVAPDRRVVTGQHGCTDSVTYRFDPVTWEASVVGTFETMLTREEHERVDGTWQVVSSSDEPSDLGLDLEWRGRGDLRPHADVWVMPVCYAIVCAGASADVTRDALVAGTIDLPGLRSTLAVAPDQRGTMTLGL